jgi:hypothetical protein
MYGRHTNPLRLLALLVCWCFVSAAQARDCSSPCAGMPCCEQEELGYDTAKNQSCCDVPEPTNNTPQESPKLIIAPPSAPLRLSLKPTTTQPPRVLALTHAPAPRTKQQLYLLNCVFRC